ncbi:Tumor protein p63-regulated protein, partial [Paragonimus heterotremus]
CVTPVSGLIAIHRFVLLFTKERIKSILREKCLKATDGNIVDLWVLTRIDHWDHDQECTVCLTDQSLLLVSLNFITEKIRATQRIALNAIHTVRVGNLVSPDWSILPGRDYGGLQIVWGALKDTKWTDLWNPLSKDVPAATFHHHPCFYARESPVDKEMYDCNPVIYHLKEVLAPLAVQPVHENIVLNARFSFLNLFYNQSNLGFCKDRNGMSF